MVYDKTHRFGFGLRQVSAVDILMRKKFRLVIVCSAIRYQTTSISDFEQEKILINYSTRLFIVQWHWSQYFGSDYEYSICC